MILVTGFGPFPSVADNPTARLARAVDGWRISGETIVGRVLDVSYERGPAEAIAVARLLQPRLVIGLGVSNASVGVRVESRAVAACVGADVDGLTPAANGDVASVNATADVTALARALGAETSADAGQYVCNAWLYRVVLALPDTPVGFVHVPAAGLDPEHLLNGIAALL